MIPIRDDIPSQRTPFFNYLVMAICSAAFFIQLSGGPDSDITERYGFIPIRLQHPHQPLVVEMPQVVQTPLGSQVRMERHELAFPAVPVPLTLITCMFLHGGWMHFLGNMWFLWIFGDNVEDRLGHIGFLFLYLITGLAAGLAHAYSSPDSPIPTIGASGAIAGVMGAYALLYPHARVLTVVPIFVILQFLVLPAPIFLGIWFAIQLIQGGVGTIGGVSQGVAWWAHVGGFVAGALAAVLVRATNYTAPPPERRSVPQRSRERLF